MFRSSTRKLMSILLLLVVLGLVTVGSALAQAPTPTSAPPPTTAEPPASLPATGAATSAPAPTATLVVPTFVPPTPVTGTTDLLVFAAASLTDSFNEIAAQFEAAHPGVKVIYNFGGSNILRAQLEQGARADVFASANTTEIENARKAELAGNDDEVFVNNRLVVITPADNPAQLQTLKDLAKPGLKLVVADKNVPVGNYFLQMLDKMSADPEYGADFGPTVLKNVVSLENNVKAVVTKVVLGEADAGVVYVTDPTPSVASQIKTFDVPDQFNTIARYPIVALKEASQPDLAKQFVAFVLAKDGGQAILQKWGFVPASPEIVATNAVTVKDASGKETTLTLADLQALPRTEVKDYALVSQSRGALGTFSWAGAALEDVLLKADPSISASNVLSVTVTAGDGYKMQLGAAEVFSPPDGKPTILAYEQDGQPMTAIQGILRLIVSSDPSAGRQVKWIKSIEVIPAQ